MSREIGRSCTSLKLGTISGRSSKDSTRCCLDQYDGCGCGRDDVVFWLLVVHVFCCLACEQMNNHHG